MGNKSCSRLEVWKPSCQTISEHMSFVSVLVAQIHIWIDEKGGYVYEARCYDDIIFASDIWSLPVL